MADERDLEQRVTALEERCDAVEQDAAAARHLAAARDRDLSEFATKIDADRRAIKALGVQVAGRFEAVDRRFEAVDRRFEALEAKVDTGFAEMDRGFAEMRGRLDATAAGQQQIVDLLTGLIDEER